MAFTLDLNSLYKTYNGVIDSLADILVSLGDVHILSNKTLLCLASPHFREAILKDRAAIRIELGAEFRASAVKDVISFIHKGEVSLGDEAGRREQFLEAARLV